MKIYTYDGSFESLLEIITYLIETNRKPDDIKTENYEPNLLDEVRNLKRTPRKNLKNNWKEIWRKRTGDLNVLENTSGGIAGAEKN